MQATTSDRVLTGRRVLIYLLAFFAVVMVANFTMMTLAIDTLPGTDVDSAYRASLAFNGEIAAAQAQDRRAWRVAAHIDRLAEGRADLRVEARDAADNPVSGLSVLAYLERPTDKRADRTVELNERGIGIYRGEAADVAAGQWELIIEATRGQNRLFQSRSRVMLP